MNLLRFAVRRVAAMAATLLAASFIVFGAMYLAPGSPASFLLTGRSASPAAVAAINAQYHLNDPFAVRYLDGSATWCRATSAALSLTAPTSHA